MAKLHGYSKTQVLDIYKKMVTSRKLDEKMLVLLSKDRKVVLSHRKTFEHVEKMRTIVDESIEMVNK